MNLSWLHTKVSIGPFELGWSDVAFCLWVGAVSYAFAAQDYSVAF